METVSLKNQTSNNMIFRNTNSHKGRSLAVTPDNSSMQFLQYGRIILDAAMPTTSFTSNNCEIGLICVSGRGNVTVGDESYELGRYDAIYIPRDSSVEISTDTAIDLTECSAKVDNKYPIQFVRYADVENDASLKFATGGESNRRTVNILLGKNIEAGRILAGVTQSEPGNWTSFPPHEHAEILEEIYVYYDMPSPAFGLQMVYTDAQTPEFVEVVRDGDAVIIPRGFHPNVAVPEHKINFVWLMAAHKEVEDRQFGVVNVQPGFDKNGTGLEASR